MKKVVHINGYTLGESNQPAVNRQEAPLSGRYHDWETVCWGEGSKLGRIPMGLWIAREIDADVIIWSTGASQHIEDKRWEASVLCDTARMRYERLNAEFPHRFTKRTWTTRHAFEAWLDRRSVFDAVSKDTLGSMNVAGNYLRDIRPPERIMFYTVSSANHAPRVGRDAASVLGIGTADAPALQRVTLLAVFAETNYGESTVRETVVRDLGH